MNQLKSTLFLFQRGYRSSRKFKTPKVPRDKNTRDEKKLYPNIQDTDIQIDEDYTEHDMDEPDLSFAHISYDQHRRESYIAKHKLKGRIVAQKYFKSENPNFITWAERDQIKSLHKKDSIEWTPDRLSQSFPALPETIYKLLKSKWTPKSVEVVAKYDQKIIENWAQFKAGNLNVEPRLAAHLENFKGRKIQVTDLKEIAEKFVKPPRVFPTPKSKVFTSIVQNYIEQTKAGEGNTKPLEITDGKTKRKTKITDMTLFHSTDKSKGAKYTTYENFLEDNVNKISDKKELDIEDHLLINEYKQQQNKVPVLNNFDTNVSVKNEDNSVEEAATSDESKVSIPVPEFDIDKNSLETGILEWKKKEFGAEEDYPRFIKIPRAKAKLGVTFKIKDRYYDSDGEFLYRVPGLRS
ncbi:uncharacterized protein LOC130664594 [Microplitis mediator]|uniref:uncharacterized protein LOC130664594 n=1 Tax=Microplitis mediator TaxID=375433 RepID=UPI0025567D46|nr:uncharacterized protein LOC130664594 [Microplitis mediator]